MWKRFVYIGWWACVGIYHFYFTAGYFIAPVKMYIVQKWACITF